MKWYYYIPTIFSHNGKKPIEIDFNKQQEFIINNDQIFTLPYNKLSNMSEVFLLHFNLEKESSMTIYIKGPNDYEKLYDANKQEEIIGFLVDEEGIYNISFKSKEKNNDIDKTRGLFDIISTEYPFELDIKENYINFNELNVIGNKMSSLKLNINSLDQDYTKKIEISNYNFRNIDKIVSIKKNNEEFKSFNFSYITFEKNANYQLYINSHKKDYNLYIFEQFNITDFSLDNIMDFSLGEYKFNDIDDKFLIINWTNYEDNIEINVTKNTPKFFLSEINIEQINNFIYEFQNYKFKELEELNLAKKENIPYEILMIELNENNTQINFVEKEKKDKHDKKDKALAWYFIVGIVVLSLILLIGIFFIVRYIRRKNTNIIYDKDYSPEPEKLLSDL